MVLLQNDREEGRQTISIEGNKAMAEPVVLTGQELMDVFVRAAQQDTECNLSWFSQNRWYKICALLTACCNDRVSVTLNSDSEKIFATMQIDQPVNITFQADYNKYLFDTNIAGFEDSSASDDQQKILLELPDRIECVQRRAYQRVPVPEHLNVLVQFWHRGYTDECSEVPAENYWQARLRDLSVGGAQIAIDLDQKPNFRVSQVVGMQFTPLSYQTPIIVEGQVVHLAEKTENGVLIIGVEFLGLEAYGQGREKLHRIKDIIEYYEQENVKNGVSVL
ncbi:MAG: PilZ domain-containing protein [Sedimentisphaerales bacterium]|nr:PilZ domain-containing protein [Sedimentisphaerales bacterium]